MPEQTVFESKQLPVEVRFPTLTTVIANITRVLRVYDRDDRGLYEEAVFHCRLSFPKRTLASARSIKTKANVTLDSDYLPSINTSIVSSLPSSQQACPRCDQYSEYL